MTGGYRGVRRGYRRLQGVTGGYEGLQEVTKGYRRLQGATEGYKGLQKTCFLTRTSQILFLGLFCIKIKVEGISNF